MSAASILRSRYPLALPVLFCGFLLASCWKVLNAVAANTPDAVPMLWVDRSIVFLAATFLAALGFSMRTRELSAAAASLIGTMVGVLFFFTWIGCAPLDPTNIRWLLHNDWAQHYAAWESYRAAPWTWPLGAIQTVWYPIGTAIVYTDALPLFALPFKLFGKALPPDFQYIGLWLLLSCVLQGVFAAQLLRLFRSDATAVIVGSCLFLLAPIFLGRFFHDTLTAHWLLLAALWLYFRHPPASSWVGEAGAWWSLATIAALVHPYLAAMFLALLLAHWARRVCVDRARSLSQGTSAISIAGLLTLFAWWLSGAFIIRYKDGSGGLFYGKHSFNLLGFFIPQGFSRIVPNIPLADPAQWEGSSYFGLAMLGLLLALALEAIRRRRTLVLPHEYWPLMAVAALLLAFAASTVLTAGPLKLIDIPVQSPLLATFRASGRFIWVPYYLILLFIIAATLRRFPSASTTLLGLAVIMQCWEFAPMHLHFAQLRTGIGWPTPEKLLKDSGWNDLLAERRHLTMFPPIACGKQAGPYLPFQLLSAHLGVTFNSGYLARWDLRATQRYCRQLADDVQSRHFSDADVYVVDSSWESKLPATGFDCRQLDGYRACVLTSPDTAR